MEEIFNQIRNAISCKLYYSALFMTVTIPDICSALQSENNKTTRDKYKNWFNKYIPKLAPNKYGMKGQLKDEDLYLIRCSLLHQGQTNNQKDYKRLLFIEPDTTAYKGLNSIHCCVIGSDSPEKSLLIDIVKFCDDMIKGGEEWLKEMENDTYYKINADKLIRRHSNGISPIIGAPVIG
ncbi:MAG: hypothetical protein JST50_05815 [Bacteroidetes bacterium]|jgi:DNA-binding ferritin-like protein (Dps family)|nr:hypothetical protein [Bacteroidota bacterium]